MFANVTDANTSNYDVIEVKVENGESSQTSVLFKFYLDVENSDLMQLTAEKTGNSSHYELTRNFLDKPVLEGEEMFNEQNEVGMAKLNLFDKQSSNFRAAYRSTSTSSKQVNKLFAYVDLNSNDPGQVKAEISSANFGVGDYPMNSKHTWFIRCNEGYQLNIEFTDFNVEPELDRVVLMSVNSGGSKKVLSEVKSTGSYRTNSNQLIVRFTSDCDVTNTGFRTVISAVENEGSKPQTTTTLPSEITTLPMETTQTINYKGNSCREIKASNPSAPSGIYTINTHYGDLDVFCQNDVDGGGWTLLQRRFDGSVSFQRNMEAYAFGFGSLDSEFWLGLEHVHRLTQFGNHEFRVDIENYNGTKGYAKYSGFNIASLDDKYRLSLNSSSYTGDAGDGMSIHIGMPFSTMDENNDGYDCSNEFGKNGNWFQSCFVDGQNLNGVFGFEDYYDVQCMYWDQWEDEEHYIKTSRMMFRSISD